MQYPMGMEAATDPWRRQNLRHRQERQQRQRQRQRQRRRRQQQQSIMFRKSTVICV